jgi:hypothetical protein
MSTSWTCDFLLRQQSAIAKRNYMPKVKSKGWLGNS